MSHGKCCICHRRFKTAASRKLAEDRVAIIADLRATVSLSKLQTKAEVKRGRSAQFRQTGNMEQH